MLNLITFALATGISAAPAHVTDGSICIAPVTAEMRASDHADPTGNHPHELRYDFYARIDSQGKVRVPNERGTLIKGLSLAKRHSVRIWDGQRRIESFFFTFRERGGNHLCLDFTPFYRTWSLRPPERRPWCKCH